MSIEFIVVVSVLGFGGLIMLFYISHSIEKQRREKALLLANLSDYVYRLQRVLDSIPLGYISKDLKLVLLGQIKSRLEKLVSLAPHKDRFRKSLDSTVGQIAELSKVTTQVSPPPLKNKDEVENLRVMLQDLSKIVEHMAASNVITAPDAKRHMLDLQKSYSSANISLMISNAEAAKAQNKPKVALVHYKNALAEMHKRNQTNMYDAKIQQITAIVSELVKLTDAPSPAKTDPNSESELGQAIDSLLEEEDAWKKKYF